jgi:hypothetical protein
MSKTRRFGSTYLLADPSVAHVEEGYEDIVMFVKPKTSGLVSKVYITCRSLDFLIGKSTEHKIRGTVVL